MRILNRKFILRYLVLIAILAVCAGAAWYMTGTSDGHAADTVLAKEESGDSVSQAVSSRLKECIVPGRSLDIPSSGGTVV